MDDDPSWLKMCRTLCTDEMMKLISEVWLSRLVGNWIVFYFMIRKNSLSMHARPSILEDRHDWILLKAKGSVARLIYEGCCLSRQRAKSFSVRLGTARADALFKSTAPCARF